MNKCFIGICSLIFALAGCTNSNNSLDESVRFDSTGYKPAIDFSGKQYDLAGGPAQVLVLGTAHLSGMSKEIPKEHLSLLLDKLIDFSPDVIAIEASNGISCGVFKEYKNVFDTVWEDYCWDPTHTLEFLKVTPAQALEKANELLSMRIDDITPNSRREMAAYFFAAGWSDSATLQWLQLTPNERTANDGVSSTLKKWLDKRVLSSNESVVIAANLGAKLGLNYLHPMDDHTADIVYHNASTDMWEIIQSVWKNDSLAEKESKKIQKQLLGSPEGVLKYYRFLNHKNSQKLTINSDFGAVAQRIEKNNIARRYVSWWQARGLRMAANVVEATAGAPNAKVLVLVGSSHKPYFESYLNQMHDFEIVSVDEVLSLDTK
ncbi:MAG: DUF5694 domain-containing protein [Psychrobium sp.]